MSSELKPCPLCDSEAKERPQPSDCNKWPVYRNRWLVYCTNSDCGLSYRGIERDAWQALPRRDDILQKVWVVRALDGEIDYISAIKPGRFQDHKIVQLHPVQRYGVSQVYIDNQEMDDE